MIPKLWPPTGRGLAVVGVVAALFLVLNLLVLSGSGFAFDLLTTLGAAALGAAAAYPTARLALGVFKDRGLAGLVGFMAGLASLFGLVFLGSALAGVPAFPTAEGGDATNAIYGFAFGFGVTVSGLSLRHGPGAGAGVPAPPPRDAGVWRKVALIVCGTILGVFGLFFLLSLAVRFVLLPLARYFAG